MDEGALTLDGTIDELLPELTNRQVLVRPDGPLTETVPAERAITVRDLLTFTWGFGMQGAMFMSAEPWPVVTAGVAAWLAMCWLCLERYLAQDGHDLAARFVVEVKESLYDHDDPAHSDAGHSVRRHAVHG